MGSRRMIPRSRWLIFPALLLAVAGGLHAASRGLPAATHAITLDGTFDDWAPVFAQADQVSLDGNASLTGAGCFPTNPDRDCVNISGQGRDVVRVATTWDAAYAYFYVARSSDYSKITHCAFVLDLDADGLAESTDRVLDATWNGGGATTLKSVDLLDYVPAAAGGDPMVCMDPVLCPAPGAVGFADGYTMRGTVGGVRWTEANVPGSATSGDRFEIRVPWSVLGVPAGTGVLWHLAVAQDGKVSSAVDNVGGGDGRAGRLGVFAVDVTPDRDGMAASPGTLTYCHEVQNRGQFRDRYNVRALSTSGAAVGVHLDPTGRCDPGTPDAVDANGDGDFTDPGELPAGAVLDTDGDGAPEIELPGGGSSTWVVTVSLPSAFHGAVELTTLEARSVTRPSLSARAVDTTRTGPLALGVDVARSGVAGGTVPLGPFKIQNTSPGALVAALVAVGPPGWPLRIHADAAGAPGALLGADLNGDGTWDAPLTSPGTLSAGQAWTFWITAGIPPGTSADTRADVELRADSPSWPRASGRAWGMVHVRAPLELLPAHPAPSLALPGYPGGVVLFPFRLVNSQPVEETVTLSPANTLPSGYAQRWYSDPDGDGNPSDGAPITAALKLPAFGGVVPLVAAVSVPESGAGTGAPAGTLATGTSATATARHDVALPAITTSSDPHAALGAVRFPPCATVHARVSGLPAGSVSGYLLRRKDPSGATVDAAALVSDRYGVAWAAFPSWGGAPPGAWQLVLESNGTPLGTAGYTVEQAATLRLDVPTEAQPGEALRLDARLTWQAGAAALEDSTLQFEVLDPALSPLGAFQSPVPRLPPGTRRVTWGSRPAFAFPAFGRHAAQARWVSSCGGELAGDLRAFAVPPWPPTLVAPHAGATVATATPVLAGQALPGSAVSLFVDGAAAGGATGSAFSVTSPLLSEGIHRWTATQSINGATSPRTEEWSFTVDTVPPTSRITAPGNGLLARVSPITVEGSAADATSGVARVEISVQGGPWQAVQGTGSWRWSFSPPSDGTWRIAARAVDLAGNVEPSGPSLTLAFDATPPDTTFTTAPPNQSPSAGASFTFTSSEPSSTFECRVDAAAWQPCSSPLQQAGLTEGLHSVDVRARDAAGNLDPTPAHHAWRVDTVAPTVGWISTPPVLTASVDATISFTSADTEAVLACSLDGAGYLPCSSPRALWGLHDGPHELKVRASDATGNTGPEIQWSWTVDATPPAAVILQPDAGSVLRAGPVKLGGSARDTGSGIARVELSVNGGPWQDATGTTAWEGSFPPGSQGLHRVSARAVDAAGNTQSPAAELSFTWDTVAPDTSFAITPSPLARSPQARFDLLSSEPPGSFECRLDAGAWAACSQVLVLSALPDGAHVLEARAQDAAGNMDPTPARFGWQLDTQPPEVSFQPPPALLTPSADLEVTFTCSEPATYLCAVDGGPAFACDTPLHLGGLSHGAHQLSVRAVDAAGNEGPAALAIWSVDLQAPGVTLTSTPPAHASAQDATLGFAVSEPAQAECSLDGRAFTPCASPHSVSGLSEGPHRVEIRARDEAGNLGPTALADWTVDTQPPSTAFGRTPAAVDPASTAEFALSANEPTLGWLCRLDGAELATPCTDPARFEWLAEGPHRVWVFAVDLAGNTDPMGAFWEWTVDTSLPDTLVISGPPRWSNSPEALFQLDSSATPATFECALDDRPWTGSSSVLLLPGLAPGPHLLACRARNAAGTWDPSPALHTWSVDLAPPGAPDFAAVAPADPRPALGGTAEPGTTVRWTLDGRPLADAAVAPSGNFSGWVATTLAEGDHLLEGRAVDAAGNVGPAGSRAFFTDTLAPVVTVASGPPDPTQETSARVEFQVEDAHPSGASCRLDGASWQACASPITYSGLGDGHHLLEVRAQDTAGNVGPAASWTWQVDTAAPALRLAEAPPALTASPSATVRLEAGEDGTALECTLDGAPLAPCNAEVRLSDLPDGEHAFSAVARDAAGNRSAPVHCAWTVDGSAPALTLTAHPGALTRDPLAGFAFTTDEAGVQFSCALDGAEAEPCTPPWLPAQLADGSHAATFTAVDLAGNRSAPVRFAWTLDTAAPVLAVTAGPGTPSATREAAFSFSTSEPSAVSCSLDGQAEISCASPWNAGPVNEGHHEAVLHPVDAAGNEGAPVRWAWDVDVTPPGSPVLDTPAAREAAPTVQGSAEPGSYVEISLDGVPAGQAVAGTNGRFELELPLPLVDGEHQLTAISRDAAGNASAPGTCPFTTDTRLPNARFASAPPPLAATGRATFAFGADEPATFECGLDGAAPVPCDPVHDIDSLADGDHTLSLCAVDLAGSRGPALFHRWSVDTVAPGVVLESVPGLWTRAAAATVAFSLTEDSAVAHCAVDGLAPGPCTSPLSLEALADGPHAVELSALDAAGNAGPSERVTWTQDTVAPTVSVVSAPAPLVSSTRAAVAYLASEPGESACVLDGAAPAPCSSPALWDALAAGPHVLLIAATDLAGNAGPPAEVRWTVDPTAPAAPVLAPLPSTVNAPPIEGSAEPGARVVISVDGQPVGEAVADENGRFSLVLPAPLREGLHDVTAVAHDDAGNAGLPAHQPVLTDTVPPTVTITFGPAPLHNLPQATFRFVASETAEFRCALDGAAPVPCAAPWITPSLPDGPHLLAVHAADGVGNAGPAAMWPWASDSQAPTVQVTRQPAPLVRVDNAEVEWLLSEPADTRCALDGAAWTACSAPLSFSGLAEGEHRLALRAVDATGNLGQEVEVRWRVDTLPPETTLVQQPAPLLGSRLALLAFTSEPGAAFDCSLDAEPFRPCAVPAVFTALADGPHRFAVRAVDEAGNPDATPEVADWEVDAREPDTAILAGPAEGALVGEDVSFRFSATLADARFECSLDASDFQPCAAEWTLQFLPTASHALAVRAVSRAGVVDTTPALRTWLTDPDALSTRKINVNAPNCGCTQAGPAWPWWGLLGLIAALKRKRR